jgi:hypothetical protein
MSDLLSQLAGSLRPCRVFMAGTLAATFGGWDMAACPRPLASGLFVLALAACGGPNAERDAPALPADAVDSGDAVPVPASAKAVLPQVARSIWGVVPDPPRRKQDLKPGLIRGTAVAVAPDTLLASCQAVGERRQVGVVRHNKYRLAQVSPGLQPDQDVCALHVADAPLNVAGGFRSFPDLRVGEPIYAVVSRTGAEYAMAEGQLVAKGGANSSLLETTLALPPGTLSAVLFDAGGNLVGLGSGGPTVDSVVVGAPLSAALAPGLAQRDLGPPAQATRVAEIAVQEPPAQRRLWVWRDAQRDSDHDRNALQFVGTTPTAALGASGDIGSATGGRTADRAADQRVDDSPSVATGSGGSSVEPAAGAEGSFGNSAAPGGVGADSADTGSTAVGSASAAGSSAGAGAATTSAAAGTGGSLGSVGTRVGDQSGAAGSVGSDGGDVGSGNASSSSSASAAASGSAGGGAKGRTQGSAGAGGGAGDGSSAGSGGGAGAGGAGAGGGSGGGRGGAGDGSSAGGSKTGGNGSAGGKGGGGNKGGGGSDSKGRSGGGRSGGGGGKGGGGGGGGKHG